MTMLTLGQAARLTGLGKTTLTRARVVAVLTSSGARPIVRECLALTSRRDLS